jgi:two-component system NtrC family sensor kinase
MDDSLVYQDLIVNHVLVPNGYRSATARDGETGLGMALQDAPDLIITDLRMPGMTGIQVLEGLCEHGCDIPVILMTLHGSEDLVVHAFRLGVKDYVIKPFGVEEMLAAIDRALTEVRLRRERDALTRDLMTANQQLDAERRQLEAVLTNTEDGVLLIEQDGVGRIVLANHAAREAFDMGGWVTGKSLAEVVDNEALTAAFEQAHANRESVQAEITLPDQRTLNAHVTPIAGVGRVAVMQDITHFKELDRIKTELVSTVSHDLRSPLTSIKGFADLLPMAGPLTEQQTYFLTKIQQGVTNITEMISDLLDLGRIEAEARMEMKPCDVGAVLSKAAAGLQSAAEIKGQTLDVAIEPDLPTVMANATRLGQALTNLVGNAIKYTPEGGHVQVSATAEDGQVLATVKDDGIGISADDLPHIFEKFFRVKSQETDSVAGSGLGLSIVKSIVDKHDGRIWVHSQVGEGSAFTVVLPVAQR